MGNDLFTVLRVPSIKKNVTRILDFDEFESFGSLAKPRAQKDPSDSHMEISRQERCGYWFGSSE